MWSGPRNISTAMMRSWGNRADTVVVDEPLYAHYLKQTGLQHPGAAEVIEHHECDWRRVAEALCAPLPEGNSIYYQKHMAQHLLPDIDRDWLAHPEFVHIFLIRDPKAMLISLDKVIPSPQIEDTGMPQQIEMVRHVREMTGEEPLIIDSRDVLQNPEGMMRVVCARLGVQFDDAMLHWPAGPRETDGIWAKYWYDNVNKSTAFARYHPKDEPLPEHLIEVYERCADLYQVLHASRLTA